MAEPTSRYLAALVDGGGTVPPELGVVRRLVERGHRVTVLAENSMAAEVAHTGAQFVPWEQAPNRPSRRPEDDPYRDWECKNPLKLLRRLIERQFVGPAPLYATEVTRALEGHQPDAVLCSAFTMGSMVAAEAAGVPFAVMLPNAYILPVEGIPPFGSGLKPPRRPVMRAVQRAMKVASTRAMDQGLPGLNRLRTDYGLEPLRHLWDQLHRADLELVMTSKAFDFEGAVPPRARYVGPVLDDPPWAGPWTPPPGADPLVMVAMSSTYQEQYRSLERVATALGDLPVRGLVTAGPALDAGVISTPPNVTVVQSAPHNEVLQHARVVITHGGHGTVVKSLAAGVPLLVLPHGRDQGDNAARVSARGAGLALRRTSRPARITAAVRRLLDDPRYAAAARTLGDQIRREASAPTLITEVERLATASR